MTSRSWPSGSLVRRRSRSRQTCPTCLTRLSRLTRLDTPLQSGREHDERRRRRRARTCHACRAQDEPTLLATAITTRTAAAALRWPLAGGVLADAVALTASRTAGQLSPASQHRLAADVAALAVTLVIAASCHVLLAFPDGRLRRPGAGRDRRRLPGRGWGRPGPGADRNPRPRAKATVLTWAAVLAGVMPVARREYARPEPGTASDSSGSPSGWCWPRMWPCSAWSCTGGSRRRFGPHGGRVLVHVLAMSGFSLVVSVVYLIVVLGLGRRAFGDGQGGRDRGIVLALRHVAAWMPSSVPVGGIRISVTTTSGCCSRTSASSCSKSGAEPTSSKSSFADTSREMPSRNSTLSSASATRIVPISR